MPDASLRQVARDLGLNEGMLGRWKRALEERGERAFIGSGHAHDQELIRLRRELAKVKQERDFLAEAAAFFVKGSR
jgi:transposase